MDILCLREEMSTKVYIIQSQLQRGLSAGCCNEIRKPGMDPRKCKECKGIFYETVPPDTNH